MWAAPFFVYLSLNCQILENNCNFVLYCESDVINIASTIKTNDMDIIYLIIMTPMAFAIGYAAHCIKLNNKRFEQMPEAKPYEFEKDEYIPEFNEFTQMLYQRRMYKGKAK